MIAIQRNALAWLIVAAVVVTGCGPKDGQVIVKDSLVERLADHRVLTAGDLANAKLTFTSSGAAPPLSRELKAFDLPDATLLLLPPPGARHGKPQNEVNDDLADARSADGLPFLTVVPFLGHQFAVPAENRVGGENCPDLLKQFPAQDSAFDSQSPSLVVVQSA